jgi:hypothetical protein
MMSEQGVNGSSKKTNEKQSRVVEYLSKLGLDEADLAKVSRLLETINSQPAPESPSLHSASAVESDGFELGGILEMQPEDLMRMLMNGDTHVAEEPAGDTVHPQMGPGSIGSQAIKLFVAEEQMVLKEAYNPTSTTRRPLRPWGLSTALRKTNSGPPYPRVFHRSYCWA